MRLLMLGIGAIGGYIGARLLEGGVDVDFLVRPQRKRTARDGLIVQSPLGDIHQQPKLVETDELQPDYDVIILTCKAFDLASACDAIRPAMRDGTRVLPLLNGIAHFDRLDEHFGRPQVMAGFAHMATERRSDGVIYHLNNFHRVVYGIRHSDQQELAGRLEQCFQKTKLDTTFTDPILQPIWDKFVFLTTLAGATCLFRASIGEILQTHSGASFIQQLLQECIDTAAAEGQAPDDATLADYRALLNDRQASYTASMLRDMQNNAPTEADHILGDMLNRATWHGLEANALALAYSNLQAYEHRRESAG